MSDVQQPPLEVPRLKQALSVPLALLSFGTVAPMVFAVVWSLWGTEVVGVLARKPTLDWYAAVFTDPMWSGAIGRSLTISLFTALSTTLFVAIVGFAGRIGGAQLRSVYACQAMVMSAFPMLVYAMGLRILFERTAVPRDVILWIGYNVTILPFVYFPVAAGSEGVATSALWSSMTLGASPWQTLRRVYAPLIEGSLWLAATIAFLLAWDELVMPLVLLDGSNTTVSKHLWDMVGSVVEPTPAVIAATTYAVLIVTALLVRWAVRSTKRLQMMRGVGDFQ